MLLDEARHNFTFALGAFGEKDLRLLGEAVGPVAGQTVEQRRLARAARSHQRIERAQLEVAIESIQYRLATIATTVLAVAAPPGPIIGHLVDEISPADTQRVFRIIELSRHVL